MSARYIQSLRYNIQQCDFILETIGWTDDEQLDDQQEAIDFIYDLKCNWQREIADVTAGMARQEARVV
jgi:predicted DNA-binding helix-hairpin-helix protein